MAYFKVSSVKVDKINAPLLVVGLGGTGADGVRRVKHEFNDRLNPDHFGGTELDRPPRTAYLELDTDDNEIDRSYLGTKINADEEWMDMSCNIPFLLDPSGKNVDPCVREWLDPRLLSQEIISAAFNGAGTYRQLSRLMLFRKAHDLLTKLTTLLTRLKTINAGDPIGARKVNVVVITGLSGGTGSGLFLDFAYLLRYAARQVGAELNLELYAIMPDVTIAHHALSDESKKKIYKTNGFAALKELDYWMSYESRKNEHLDTEELTVNYGSGLQVMWESAPYDDVTLLCATNAQGAMLNGAYEVVMNAISETLLLQMSGEASKGDVVSRQNADHTSSEDAFSFQSSKSNENAYKGLINRPYPMAYCYRTVGAYSNASEQKDKIYMEAELVFNDAREFCELPEHIPNMQTHAPEEFYEPFSTLISSEFKNDFENETPVKREMFDNEAPWSIKDLQGMADLSAPHGTIREDWEKSALSAVDRCSKKYLKQLTDRFIDIAKDYIRKNGPIGLRTMLNDPTKGFLKQLETQIGSFKTQRDMQKSSYLSALRGAGDTFVELRDLTGLFSKNKAKDAYQRYINQASSVYKCKRDELYYALMAEMLETFRTNVAGQILGRNIEFVINALKAIQENVSTEVRTNSDAMRSNPMSDPETIREQIQKLYADEANKLRLRESVLESVADACLVFDDKAVRSADEAADKLINKINGIMESVYHDINDVTLQKQLSQFGDINDNGVEQYVRSVIAPNLERGAQAHFTLSPKYAGLNTKNAVLASYISVPQGAEAVKKGIKDFVFNSEYTGSVIKTGVIQDRIFWMNIVSGLPLCAYGPLAQYEKVYEEEKEKRPGTHLVMVDDARLREINEERSVRNDWNRLPSPVPVKEFAELPLNENVKKRYSEVEALVDKAIAAGIVCPVTEGSYKSFSTTVRLLGNSDGTVMTLSQGREALNAINSNQHDFEGKLDDINEFLTSGTPVIFDPVNDVRMSEQIEAFSMALNKSGVFNGSHEAQTECFRELIIHMIGRRPALMDAIMTNMEITKLFEARKKEIDEILNLRNKLNAARETVTRLWIYGLICFNHSTVGYKNRKDDWETGGEENILFTRADTVCKADYASYAPIYARLVRWYAHPDRDWNKYPFKTLTDKLQKLYDASMDPRTEEDKEACRAYRAKAEELIEMIDNDITQLNADQDEMPQTYYNETLADLEQMQKKAKALKSEWRRI